ALLTEALRLMAGSPPVTPSRALGALAEVAAAAGEAGRLGGSPLDLAAEGGRGSLRRAQASRRRPTRALPRTAVPVGALPAVLARAASGGIPARTRSDEPALCFYTSGTTKDPKAVLHAHRYTFAHRYTGEYWLDLQRADLHWTTSDTGWAKAAYGVLFGPWM